MNQQRGKNLTEREAIFLVREIREILSLVDDRSFGEIILDKFKSIYDFDYAHIAQLDDNLRIDIHNSKGEGNTLLKAYKKKEEYCLSKQNRFVNPSVIVPFNITCKMWSDLSAVNPAYESMSEVVPEISITSMIHPEKLAIVGIRYNSDDLTSEQLNWHSIMSPIMIESYYLHNKMNMHRDIQGYLVGEISRLTDDAFVITDNSFQIIAGHDEFHEKLRRYRISWDTVRMILQRIDVQELRNIFSLRDFFRHPTGSMNVMVKIEPLCIGKCFYYKIGISEIKTKGALTPREHEIYHLIRKGYTNKMIGEILDISAETVKRHLVNMFGKTGASNRTELSHMEL